MSPACFRQLILVFSIAIGTACVSVSVNVAQAQSEAPAESIRDWTLDDFKKRGHVVTPPAGEQSEQLKFWKWPGDNTLLDLRESRYLAHENGPFGTEPLSDVETWPTGGDLREYRECTTFEKYPISIRGRGSRNILVLGAHVVGVQPRELPWRIMKGFHDGDGIRIEAPGEQIVDRAYMDNVQDGFSPRGGGYWILRNSYLKYVRDDFVENDGLLSGEIVDCLADGVYVFLSARPGKSADPEILDAREPPVVKIRDTLVHLQPMPYDGDMKLTAKRFIKDGKTCGQLFKWSRWGGTVEVSNCIIRWDQMAASGPTPMSFPKGTYENVTLIWLGEGDFPKPLPEGVTLSRDVKLWGDARAAWLKRHKIE